MDALDAAEVRLQEAGLQVRRIGQGLMGGIWLDGVTAPMAFHILPMPNGKILVRWTTKPGLFDEPLEVASIEVAVDRILTSWRMTGYLL